MVITKKYARKLIRQGKARNVGVLKKGYMMILERLDLQRTDHYIDKKEAEKWRR